MRLSLHAKIKARKHTMLASPFFLYGTETASRSTPFRQMENALSRTVLLTDTG